MCIYAIGEVDCARVIPPEKESYLVEDNNYWHNTKCS